MTDINLADLYNKAINERIEMERFNQKQIDDLKTMYENKLSNLETKYANKLNHVGLP